MLASITKCVHDLPNNYGNGPSNQQCSVNQHPYGEINCVVPIDPTFELEGLPVGENWQGKIDIDQTNRQCASNHIHCFRCRLDLACTRYTPLPSLTRRERRCAVLPAKWQNRI